MKQHTFFEKFDLFADAPDAVGKMRALIWRFAITGQLSARGPEDAPVGELLDALNLGKAQVSKNTRKNVLKPVASKSETELPITTPDHWAWVPLSDMGAMSGGMTPSKAKSAFWDGDVNWFSSKDVKTDELTESELKITRGAAEATGLRIYSPGCLVMVARSGILKRTFPVSILRAEGTVNQDLKVLRPFVAGIERYIQIMLRGMTDFILSSLVKTGMTVQSLKYEDFEVQPFPLPPLAEQKRIVAKVGELMALCDRLESQQQERETRQTALARASLARFADAPTPDNLRFLFHSTYHIPPADLRKSIFTLAVQGKLVAQDPNDGLAEELLVLVETERRRFADAHRFRSPAAKAVDYSSIPFNIPPSWKWCRLSSLFSAITDGDHLPPPKSDDGIAFLTIGNITTGELDFEGSRFVPESYYRELADFRRPRRGDILYTVVGATYGRAALVEVDRPFCVQRHIAILKPSPRIDVGFLMIVLRSPLTYRQAAASTTGTAQPTIPLGSLRNFIAALPPLSEQRRIVAKVNELMILVNQLEDRISAATKQRRALLEAAIHTLLGPSAEIIQFSSAQSEPLPDRAAIGCYTIQQLADRRTFGRTAEVKVLYLAEAHIGLDLGGRYLRDAAGPLDQWIYTFEEQAAAQQWFSVVERSTNDGHKKIDYRKGPKLAAKAREAATRLPPELRTKFDGLLALLSNKPTVEVEIIATLFASWNDSLIDGHTPSDAEIIRDVRENWHPSKQRFKEPELKKWLDWMRQNSLAPKGRGPHTRVSKAKLCLH